MLIEISALRMRNILMLIILTSTNLNAGVTGSVIIKIHLDSLLKKCILE